MRDSRRSHALLPLWLCVPLMLATEAAATFTPGTVHPRSLVSGSETRLFDVYTPPGYDGSVPVPLVIDVHGFESNKTEQRAISGIDLQANLHGFLVAYPQGLFGSAADPEAPNSPFGPSWNSGNQCCGLARTLKIDDSGFLRAVANAVASEGNVDPQRVYITGLSNGAGMSHRLACEAAGTFAAAAPISFPLGLLPLSSCQPSRPVAVLHFAGLTDTLVPYAGGPLLGVGPVVPSAATSFAYWRDVDGCGSGSPNSTTVYGDSQCATYTSCDGGAQVGICSILAAPLPPYPGHVLYVNDDVDVAATTWQFLSQFTAPASTCGDGVLALGEECDDGNVAADDGCGATCELELCGPTPEIGCRRSQVLRKARLSLRDDLDDSKDRVQWRWAKGAATTKGQLGNPLVDESYALCIHAGGALRSSTHVPAAGTCGGGLCWKETAKGYRYWGRAPGPEGVIRLALKSGAAGKAILELNGRGTNLEMPGSLAGTVTVQLKASGGFCWQALFAEPFKKNDGVSFIAVGE